MMRITVEIVPFGSEPNKHTVREVNIWNVGFVGDPEIDDLCEYLYSEAPTAEIVNWLPDERAGRADGSVLHMRSKGADDLAAKVLMQYAS